MFSKRCSLPAGIKRKSPGLERRSLSIIPKGPRTRNNHVNFIPTMGLLKIHLSGLYTLTVYVPCSNSVIKGVSLAARFNSALFLSIFILTIYRRSAHFILHPILGFWLGLISLPAINASMASRKSFPVTGMSFPGRESSNCPL